MSYRVPREPSTPRIAIWRKLKELGVVQVGDGLVALPHDARTKEQLEWVAAAIDEAEGHSIVWVATPTMSRRSDDLARQLRSERSAEYRELLDEAERVERPVDARTLARLRRQWRRIDRRDPFRSPHRDEARIAVNDLATARSAATAEPVSRGGAS